MATLILTLLLVVYKVPSVVKGQVLDIGDEEPSSNNAICVDPLLPRTNKTVYKVGVLANRGFDVAVNELSPTFTTYLTHMVGDKFAGESVAFETVPVAFDDNVLDSFESGEYDFMYANPAIFSCIETEIGVNSLVSQIARRRVSGQEYDLTQ